MTEGLSVRGRQQCSMRFDLSQSRLKKVIAVGIVALVAIGLLLNWAQPVSAQSTAPTKPDAPALRALHLGMVEVDWNDVSGAREYEVQFWGSDGWIDIPDTDLGIEAFFYGSRVVVTGLPRAYSYDAFQVRAGNSLGWSGWSDFAWEKTTHDMDWEGIPVPVLEPTPMPEPNTPATGTPTVSGTPQVRETLTADTSGIDDKDGLTAASFDYQWLADDADITGATGNTYVLTSSELDKTIKFRVSFTDDRGNDEVLTSAATGAVGPKIQQQTNNTPATEAPTISGTARVGETLTADTSGIADADGLTNVSYSYQWVSNDGTSDTNITGATDSTSSWWPTTRARRSRCG